MKTVLNLLQNLLIYLANNIGSSLTGDTWTTFDLNPEHLCDVCKNIISGFSATSNLFEDPFKQLVDSTKWY